MNEVALAAIRDRVSRRAQIKAWVADAKEDHADTIDRNDKPRRQVNDAIRAAGGPSAPRGKVVAELTFGFWRYLTTRTHDATLWVPYLRWAFRSA